MHSIAAGIMLKKEEVHFFNDIAYYHVPFTHCPTGEKLRAELGCHCNPKENFDWKGYSCTSLYHAYPAETNMTQARRDILISTARTSPKAGRASKTKQSWAQTSPGCMYYLFLMTFSLIGACNWLIGGLNRVRAHWDLQEIWNKA